ncbi:MFS transporter [Candidatus Margulisiibacteriota bacterium]
MYTKSISKWNYLILFLCYFFDFTIGNYLLFLLPVHTSNLGAKEGIIGIFLAIASFSLVLGSILGGVLADKIKKRKSVYIITTILALPTYLVMAITKSIPILSAATSLLWFFGGCKLIMLVILLNLYSEKTDRRKNFMLLSLAGVVGLLVGGIILGPIADKFGYPFLFYFMGCVNLIFLGLGFFLKEIQTEKTAEIATAQKAPKIGFSSYFYLFVLASIISWTATSFFNVGRSIIMNNLGYNSSAISIVIGLGCLASIPAVLTIFKLLDRFNHKIVLYAAYIIQMISLFILAVSTKIWMFWLATLFASSFFTVSQATGQALTSDLTEEMVHGKALALYNVTIWTGLIIGSATCGFAVQILGHFHPFVFAVSLPIISCLILYKVKLYNS